MTEPATQRAAHLQALLIGLLLLPLVVPACKSSGSRSGTADQQKAASVTPVVQPKPLPLPPTKPFPGPAAKKVPVPAPTQPRPVKVAQLTPSPTTAPPFDPATEPAGQVAPAASGGFAAALVWAGLAKKGLKPFGPVDAVAVPGSLHTQGKVMWRHDFHAQKKGLGIACTECHHEAKAAKGPKKHQKCGTCHRPQKSTRYIAAKEAFHKNCLGCHRKAVAAAAILKNRAPTDCDGCHKK